MSKGEDVEPDLEPSLANERVGYGRPPMMTRFRPGQSGNPRGRPKGAQPRHGRRRSLERTGGDQ
jgi:hypothetical protein